jgi:signal transduction histidine kinase
MSTNEHTILVVDDDEALRYAYRRQLESEGLSVITAGSGEECREVVRRERPALVLLDAVLGDINGFDLCREIKSSPESEATFILMISGHRTTTDDQVAGLESGADGFLTKPIEKRALVAHVRAMLRIKDSERALRESRESYRLLAEELAGANRRLEEFNQLKAEFVANMSHELRTPLNAIIGFAQLMQMGFGKGVPLQGPHADAVERILRNSHNLLSLIDSVLDLSKIEAGLATVHPEYFDLPRAVEMAFAELQSLADQKGITYRLRVLDELPIAFSDPLRLRQVVVNLLSNAIKFTDDGIVEATLSRADADHWRLRVRDSGVGIKKEHIAVIFDRFRQVDGSTTRQVGGTGLGLAIAKEILAQLGGTIDVESTFGIGSVFTVTAPYVLPKSEAPSKTPPRSAEEVGEILGPAPSGANDEGEPLVVVIEDDRDGAELLRETLAEIGYRVEVGVDGRHGLDLVRKLLPSAVTLDIMMPSMDGWSVLRAMKEDPTVSHIPVIVVSIVDNRPLGYRLGASEYLVKPVEPTQLVDALKSVGATTDAGAGYVLIVDDERPIRDLLSIALRHVGYEARTAPSGEVALNMIAAHAPSAVLTDLFMPGGMSGFELIARLRSTESTAALPILVITGKDLTNDDRLLMKGQIADVIRKGDLLLPDLEARLRDTLEEHGVPPKTETGEKEETPRARGPN